jgi:multicomponent Na+:H+ antiporter subunit E
MDVFTASGKKIRSKARSRNPVVYIKKAGWFLIYIVVFLYECLKANLDVAYRVLHPDLPIRPGTIRVKMGLKSDTGITFLANSVTLTPGTTTVDVDKAKGCLYVHWLYVQDGHDASNASLPVVEKFEKILRRIFE